MEALNDDTYIYRIFNVYDLLNTLSTSSIRLSQVARMEDRNELFGIYFDLLRSHFGPHNEMGIEETQRNFHEAQKHHYMTCWTRAPDNIAVWSLYSPLKESIQVRTKFGSLRKAVDDFSFENSFSEAYGLAPNDPRDLFYPADIGAVKYVDFEGSYNAIKKECLTYFRARDRWLDENVKSGEAIFHSLPGWPEADDDIRRQIFSENRPVGPLLKDARYTHEKEVRFVLSLTRRDGRTKEEYDAHPMAGLDDPVRRPPEDQCPDNVFVPFDIAHFGDFQVDGRIDDYKFDAISRMLQGFGVSLTKNESFSRIEI